MPGYTISEFGGRPMQTDEANDIAGLHAELLGHSPLVLMGPRFMRDFYYTALPEAGFISGAVAYVDGQAAGFIVATADPAGFMAKALRAHWWRAAWSMFVSVVRHPSRLLAMKEAYEIQSNVQAEEYGEHVGELLSFGVLPQFRSRGFLKETGLYIGSDLAEAAVKQLRHGGKSRIRAIVDKDNLEAQLFYRSQGWKVGLKTVKGWRVPTIEFILNLDVS